MQMLNSAFKKNLFKSARQPELHTCARLCSFCAPARLLGPQINKVSVWITQVYSAKEGMQEPWTCMKFHSDPKVESNSSVTAAIKVQDKCRKSAFAKGFKESHEI